MTTCFGKSCSFGFLSVSFVWDVDRQGCKQRCRCLTVTFFNTLKQELSGTKAYEETWEDDKSVVFWHSNDVALKFSVKDQQDKLSTIYLLPKLHKRAYIASFIANFTTELSKLLISCPTAIKTM